MIGPDVAVIGLGVIGSAIAAELAARGVRVLGLERRARGTIVGASRGDSRLLRLVHFEDPRYVPLARRALEGWRALERPLGMGSLLRPTGAVVVGAGDGALVAGTRASAAANGITLEPLAGDRLAGRLPWLRLGRADEGVLEPEAGLLLPGRCVETLRARAVEAGAIVRYDAPATIDDPDGALRADRPVSLRVGDERIVVARVVVAAGGWTAPLLAAARCVPRLHVERVVSGWVAPARPLARALADAPVVLWDRAPRPLGLFPPVPGGPGLKVTHHGGRAVPDVAALEPAVTPADLAPLAEDLAAAAPGLAGPFVAAEACHYTHTDDGRFAIGALGSGRVILAAACCGHGFKFAPAIGERVADLIAGRDAPGVWDFVRPDRPSLAGGRSSPT